MKVEIRDEDESEVCENEESVCEPEQNLEEPQATVEPESVVSQATIRVFHQDESEFLIIDKFASYHILPKQNRHEGSVEPSSS